MLDYPNPLPKQIQSRWKFIIWTMQYLSYPLSFCKIYKEDNSKLLNASQWNNDLNFMNDPHRSWPDTKLIYISDDSMIVSSMSSAPVYNYRE